MLPGAAWGILGQWLASSTGLVASGYVSHCHLGMVSNRPHPTPQELSTYLVLARAVSRQAAGSFSAEVLSS